ncbi:hypothetical protein [Corynebacterium variabile]|uniref:hypothetical protein n=1 Tax=Corynebacterium variabile TaxID=1727 RepID=UPI0002FCC502|nr:hypothetical protein [Corynebacterium variabile]
MDSLFLDEASREALIGAAKAVVATLARLTTREDAILRVGLPEVARRGPANVLPIARDSAVIECPLRVFDTEAPRELVLFPVPDHRTARSVGEGTRRLRGQSVGGPRRASVTTRGPVRRGGHRAP